MNIRQSEEIKMMQRGWFKLIGSEHLSTFQCSLFHVFLLFFLITDAFDYVSPRSLDSSHGYRQSQMLLNTRAFKLKNEAKALQKKIEQIRKKAHDEAY